MLAPILCLGAMLPVAIVADEEVWIGHFKMGSDAYLAHFVGTTQELICRPDGTCLLTTMNGRLLSASPQKVTRTGTYERVDSDSIKFKLTKDGETAHATATLIDGVMVFPGGQAPFTFSKPTVFARAQTGRTQMDGFYRLSMYGRATSQFVSFPDIVAIKGSSYTVGKADAPPVEKGSVTFSPKNSTSNEMVLKFSAEGAKGRLHNKSWINVFGNEVWSPTTSFADAFPELRASAEGFDLILLEKILPNKTPQTSLLKNFGLKDQTVCLQESR